MKYNKDNEIIKFIDIIKTIANNGGVSEKTSNQNHKGSKSLEKIAEDTLEGLGMLKWTDQYTNHPKHKEIKNYLYNDDTIPKDLSFARCPNSLIPDNSFISQPGGTQYSVDLIIKYKGRLIYIEFKTGGGTMPKYNDRFPFACCVVIFVSSHKGKTMLTGEIEKIDLGYYSDKAPKRLRGKHKGYKEKKLRVPNPFLENRCVVFFQGDILSISNYEKIRKQIELVQSYNRQIQKEMDYDETMGQMLWRPIMSTALTNIYKPCRANEITKTCKERQDHVYSKLNDI